MAKTGGARAAWLAAGVCALWIGCASGDDGGHGADPSGPAADPGTRERAVHVTMVLEVPSVADAVDGARASVDRAGGYVETSEVEEHSARLELRVPASALAETRAALGALGRARSTSEDVEDVTLTHADQQARLTSARAEEARLAEMFATRTASLADVLAVEHELSRVRGEIERLDAEERALEDRIAMARITIVLAPPAPTLLDDPIATIAGGAMLGVRTAGAIGVAVLAIAAFVAPSTVVAVVLAWMARALRRRLRRCASSPITSP